MQELAEHQKIYAAYKARLADANSISSAKLHQLVLTTQTPSSWQQRLMRKSFVCASYWSVGTSMCFVHSFGGYIPVDYRTASCYAAVNGDKFLVKAGGYHCDSADTRCGTVGCGDSSAHLCCVRWSG